MPFTCSDALSGVASCVGGTNGEPIDTYETGKVDEDRLSKVLQELVNLSPRGIREHLGLNKPIYARTAAYGHFGRTPDLDGGFSWERTDLVNDLRSAFA